MQYKGYYVTFVADCDDNTGGYFCEIYEDESFDNRLDFFCIYKDSVDCKDDTAVEDFAKQMVDSFISSQPDANCI